MSTPTTATATLPPYAAGYPFSHPSSYRQTLPGSASRLGPSSTTLPSPTSSSSYAPYSPSAVSNSVHLATVAMNNGAPSAPNHAHHARSLYHPTTTHNQSHNHSSLQQNDAAVSSPGYPANGTLSSTATSTTTAPTTTAATFSPSTSTMDGGGGIRSAAHTMSSHQHPNHNHHHHHQTHSTNGSQPPRKRRRSGPPDWESFYRNGLPQEVIVIEDSPERDAGQTGSSRTEVGYAANGVVGRNDAAAGPASTASYHYGGQQSDGGGGDRHIAKKQRRQLDEPAALSGSGSGNRYDPVHNYVQTSSGSTVSSERTHSNSNSSLYTTTATTAANTAATSLASTNGQYEYDASIASQKRKRALRQQIAIETKKLREHTAAALGSAFANYRPPPLPPIKAPDVNVKIVHDAHYGKSVKVDDDDGHYIVIPESDLTDRYQMVKLLGQGTFGKVVQARDRRKNELVAIKIIRSVQKYRDASRIELRVLETLKANDRENRNRCIHLRECFDFRGHICIVMDLLGQSVFDFLKGNGFVPFPNSQIQSFARQLFTSVAFLHDLQLIHTDLKPENILLVDSNYQTFTYNRKIPSSSSTIARQATQRKVLLDTEIRLIDFGSATFQDEYHSSVVSTRHYRAPEIILGLGWSFPCDIWSIGCILVEFFTGDALFQTHDNLEHLAMMEAVCDNRMDPHLVQQVAKSTRHGGNPASKYFKRLRLDYPNNETTRASRRFVKAMKKLNDIIPSSNGFLRQFLDLLRRIFVYDPTQRITAKEALQHPWFREVAVQDDGTEAAKIRHERARASRERTGTRAAQLRG
ncbi:protein kinase [Niveomyces insectorum RCEF 264]|uniref:dual-specificity kinase n=1 Tax=Niveomyces insectorum RCEF 264 TaxID=1081102 RepID=A0A167RIC1_9HYPO|nr:protein kinase [Niveomyces insectorum RCEF 264]